jgi:large subunit ribosomal protein L49
MWSEALNLFLDALSHQYQKLGEDLSASLYESGLSEKSGIKMEVSRSRHLIIHGGKWKNHILEWLVQKGF